jgi:hypothetical protein
MISIIGFSIQRKKGKRPDALATIVDHPLKDHVVAWKQI